MTALTGKYEKEVFHKAGVERTYPRVTRPIILMRIIMSARRYERGWPSYYNIPAE
jgi:hypothetical protein